MTTIVKDRDYLKASSWKEIFEAQAYTNSLDSTKEKLKEIIGKYDFPTMEKCGLANCGTRHNKGYVVRTASGQLTNLGHFCGKKYFGIEFENLSRQFDRVYKDYQARERINDFRIHYAEYLAKSEIIEDTYGSIDLAYRMQQFFSKSSKGCHPLILEGLKRMVRNRNPNIYKTESINQAEYDLLESSGQKNPSWFKQTAVDSINGLSFIYLENDLRIYAQEFKTPFNDLLALNLDTLTSKQLDMWSKKIGEFNGVLDRIEEIMSYSQQFCCPSNILKFIHFMPNAHKEFRQFLTCLKTNFGLKT